LVLSGNFGRLTPWRLAAVLALCLAPLAAQASLLSPEMEDKVADVLTIVVLIVAPLVGIGVFWIVHVLPEKIAEKKQHPQKHAIHTLCLLSLVFGGLLWPIAWLWAFTKPIGHKLAYGTDKDDEYYEERGAKLLADDHAPVEELVQLRDELDFMATKGSLPLKLQALRASLGLRIAADKAVPIVS
jgi:hypothetical protein